VVDGQDTQDVLDLMIRDEETVGELRLVTALLVVALSAPDRLDQDVIDAALGIERAPRKLSAPRSPGSGPSDA
jgi:hypothetical protein